MRILSSALPAPPADTSSAATKSKTSEDIAQSSKYSPAYSPDPYYHSESEYWSFQGSPKGNRFPLGWENGKRIPASKFPGREPCFELGLDPKVGLGSGSCQGDPKTPSGTQLCSLLSPADPSCVSLQLPGPGGSHQGERRMAMTEACTR